MRKIVVSHTGFEGLIFVMPAKAGIQDLQVEACNYASWIPGLAMLARNDATSTPQNQYD